MDELICKQCDAILYNPCEIVYGLFTLKAKILNTDSHFPVQKTKDSLASLNYFLKNTIKLTNHEEKFEQFQSENRFSQDSPTPSVFVLTCFRGHTDQYTVTCP